jgi:hypothetical protein
MYFKLIRITYYLAHGEAYVCVRVFMHAYPRVFTCVMYSSSFDVRRRAARQCNKICIAYREERQKQSVGIEEEEKNK